MTPKPNEGEVHKVNSTQRTTTRMSSPEVGQTNYSPNPHGGGQSKQIHVL